MGREENKGSQRSAQSSSDQGKELLMEFVQAVENEYCRQNSTPQILKWSSVEPLVKRLRNLDDASIRESQQKIFFEYLLQYLEIALCFITSFEDSEYKKQKNYATALLSFVPSFFKEVGTKNAFIARATAKVLDLFMFGDFCTVGKAGLLRMFNDIASQSSKQVRIDTAQSIDYYMYKLIDSLSTYGDFMIQSEIMETLFRIFGSQIRNSHIQYELLPGSEELGKSLISDISVKTFDSDVRLWLNKFNSDSQLIFSLPCKTLMFGNTICERFDDNLNATWVDFNMKENMISFFSGDSGNDQWNRIIILAKDVKKVEVNRQFTSTENTTVFMHLSKPCISEIFERQEYWNSLDRHFKIIISGEEKEKITKLISQVLPRLFGDTFSHSSARISGRLKPVYKPLKIPSKRRSSPSDLSSVSSKSKSDAVQQAQTRHSAVRVPSPSLSGSNAYKSPVYEIKQSGVKLDLAEDNISEVVTDFTKYSSNRNGIASRRASLLTSPDSDMFMSVSPTPDLFGNDRSLRDIEKIQDNIVTSSHGADDADETLTSPRIEILSGQCTGSRPVSMHRNVSEFRSSEQFSSTPVKVSNQIIKEFSDEFLGDAEVVKPSDTKEKETLVAQKISTFLDDVETVERLQPLAANEKEAPVTHKFSTLKADEDVDKNPTREYESPLQIDDLSEEFHSAEIENVDQKRDYINKVKENYVIKVSALSPEDLLDDDFETAVEHLTDDIVDIDETENDREREARKYEVSEKVSQFVDDNLQREAVNSSSDDASVRPDAESKISHYHIDTNVEQCNENLCIITDKTDSKTDEPTEGNSQLLPSNKKTLLERRQSKLDIIIPPSEADLSQETSGERNYKHYSEIPTPDLFDLPTELNKVNNRINEQENYSQNDSEDIFSRSTQENRKIGQRSQPFEQSFPMLSLAVNVGNSEYQYSETVAIDSRNNMIDLTSDGDEAEIMKEVQPETDLVAKNVENVAPVKSVNESEKKSREKIEDNMVDLTLDGDDAVIMKDVQNKTGLVGKVHASEPSVNTPQLLAANSECQYSKNVAVVKPVIESKEIPRESDEQSNIIDLTVDEGDAEIMKEVQHRPYIVGKVTADEPVMNTPELYGILTSNGSQAAGTESLTHGSDKRGTSRMDETVQEENLTVKKKPRTLIRTGKKQFRLEDLSEDPDTTKTIDGKIGTESNEVAFVASKSPLDSEKKFSDKPVDTRVEDEAAVCDVEVDEANRDEPTGGPNEPAESSESDIEWAPDMNAANMDFMETFDKMKEMEEQKTAVSRTVEGNRDAVDTEMLLKDLDQDLAVTQLSGTSDFIRKKPVRRINTESSESDIEWAPDMNAANMGFIETFDKMKEMEEQRTATSVHREEKTVEGNRDAVDMEMRLKGLDEDKSLTQLSGMSDFIRKKPIKRIHSSTGSEASEDDEDRLLKKGEKKENIENDSKVANLENLKKEPELYVKISRIIKKSKKSKRKKPETIIASGNEISRVKLEQHVHGGKTGELDATIAQEDSHEAPHVTQDEAARINEEAVSRNDREEVSEKVIEKPKESKRKKREKARPPLKEISQGELEQRVRGRTGQLHIIAQEDSDQAPHPTQYEAACVDEEPVSRNDRDGAEDGAADRVIKKPKELKRKKREKKMPPPKEISQRVYGKADAQEGSDQAPHVINNEAARVAEEPVSRNDRYGAGDGIAEKEMDESEKIRVGAETHEEVAHSPYRQDESVDVTMREAAVVTDASSDKQALISLVEREKPDSSPDAIHHQTIITIAQVHSFESKQQTHAKVCRKSAEQHPQFAPAASKLAESPAVQPVQHQSSPISKITNITDLPSSFPISPDLDFGEAPNFLALKQNENIEPVEEKCATINKADEVSSQDSDLVPRKRSPILTRNKSKEPVTVKSPHVVIVENNDLFDKIEVETSKQNRKLYKPGSYSYLDDLLDGEMNTGDSDHLLPIAIEKGTKIPKQRKPRTKKKSEEPELSEKKKKEKTPRKTTKPVEESSKEGVKKRRPRKKKGFSLSTTNIKNLDEIFNMSCRDLANHPWGYNYSAQSKSILNTPLDVVVRSAPRNSSSDESPQLTKFLDKEEPSPEQTGPQSSEYSWPELEVVPEKTKAAEPRVKINILQDIVIKPKRPSPYKASSPVSKKPKLDVAEDVHDVVLPSTPEIVEYNVQNDTKEAETGEDVIPNLLNTLQYIISLVAARNNPNSVQKLKEISSYIDQLKH